MVSSLGNIDKCFEILSEFLCICGVMIVRTLDTRKQRNEGRRNQWNFQKNSGNQFPEKHLKKIKEFLVELRNLWNNCIFSEFHLVVILQIALTFSSDIYSEIRLETPSDCGIFFLGNSSMNPFKNFSGNTLKISSTNLDIPDS